MKAAVQKSVCPTDETLALFIEGRLDSVRRPAVVEHLAGCAECRDIVSTADELAGQDAVPLVYRSRRRSWIATLAGLAGAAAVAYAIYLGPLGDRLMAPRRLRTLAAATDGLERRPIAARPSLDIAYKQHEVFRSSGPESLGDPDLLAAGATLEDAAKRHPTATNLHQLGLAYLLLSDDRAVEKLEAAVKEGTGSDDLVSAISSSTDADLLNDLAAAYNERRNVAARDAQRSVSAATRAWQLKRSPAIAWTRATVLDTRESWNDYLSLDSKSAWAAEARQNLAHSIH
jgi:hypothetical protein